MPSPLPPELTTASERNLLSEGIMLGGGMLLFLGMLYEMRESLHGGGFLSPPLLATAGALVLWPLRQQRSGRTILFAGGALLLLWLLNMLSMVLLPFILAFLLAYLFNPLAAWLHGRFNISRAASALMVTTLVGGAMVLLVSILVPSMVNEVGTLGARALSGMEALERWLNNAAVVDRFADTGLIEKETFVMQVTALIQQSADSVTENLPALVQNVFSHAASVLGLIAVLAIMPVLIYYMLKDYPSIKGQLEDFFPTVGGQRDYLVRVGEVVGSYLRAQLTICAIGAVVVSVVLLLFGVPFALLIGLMAGVFNIIPNLGALITAVLGVLIAVIFGDPWLFDAVVVLAVLVGQNLLEQSVLVPRIMSAQVGLHPVLILLALFVFGYFLGLVGLIIAVPLTALLVALYRAYRSDLHLDLAPEAQLKRDLARRLRGG